MCFEYYLTSIAISSHITNVAFFPLTATSFPSVTFIFHAFIVHLLIDDIKWPILIALVANFIAIIYTQQFFCMAAVPLWR